MKPILKNLIIIIVTTGLIWYIYTIALNWQLITEGNLWIGVISILIPSSINVIIYLVLYNKIKIWKTKQEKELNK